MNNKISKSVDEITIDEVIRACIKLQKFKFTVIMDYPEVTEYATLKSEHSE